MAGCGSQLHRPVASFTVYCANAMAPSCHPFVKLRTIALDHYATLSCGPLKFRCGNQALRRYRDRARRARNGIRGYRGKRSASGIQTERLNFGAGLISDKKIVPGRVAGNETRLRSGGERRRREQRQATVRANREAREVVRAYVRHVQILAGIIGQKSNRARVALPNRGTRDLSPNLAESFRPDTASRAPERSRKLLH